MKDMIQDGIDGIFIEPKSVESLMEGLKKALESSKKREIIGKNARTKVMEKYEIQGNIEQLLMVYMEVLKIG
jgi:glycosyltransferase involved in cell wall biosynthesis